MDVQGVPFLLPSYCRCIFWGTMRTRWKNENRWFTIETITRSRKIQLFTGFKSCEADFGLGIHSIGGRRDLHVFSFLDHRIGILRQRMSGVSRPGLKSIRHSGFYLAAHYGSPIQVRGQGVFKEKGVHLLQTGSIKNKVCFFWLQVLIAKYSQKVISRCGYWICEI